MQFTVMTIGVYDDAQEAGKQRVYGHFTTEFDLDGITGGAGGDVNFELADARSLTYGELEKIILEKAQEAFR